MLLSLILLLILILVDLSCALGTAIQGLLVSAVVVSEVGAVVEGAEGDSCHLATVLGLNWGFHTTIDSFFSVIVVFNLLLSAIDSATLLVNSLMMHTVIGCGFSLVGWAIPAVDPCSDFLEVLLILTATVLRLFPLGWGPVVPFGNGRRRRLRTLLNWSSWSKFLLWETGAGAKHDVDWALLRRPGIVLWRDHVH